MQVAFGAWLSTPILQAWRTNRAADHFSEASFPLPGGPTKRGDFGSIYDPPSVELSVVVPAYNEVERMREGVDDMLRHLAARQSADPSFTWEVIFVDDGSTDATFQTAMDAFVTAPSGPPPGAFRVLRAHKNGGKGAAVRKGVMKARGRYVLMADADGATQFSDVDRLLAALKGGLPPEAGAPATGPRRRVGTGVAPGIEKDGHGFAVGSRAHMGGGVQRSGLRRVLMWGFHSLIRLALGGVAVEDTQCGFKLWTRASAAALFSVLHIERWAFDVELVYLAGRLSVPTVEVPVTWHEVGGSKVKIASASLQMLRDTIVIRACYSLGVWTDKAPPPPLRRSLPRAKTLPPAAGRREAPAPAVKVEPSASSTSAVEEEAAASLEPGAAAGDGGGAEALPAAPAGAADAVEAPARDAIAVAPSSDGGQSPPALVP